MVFFIESDVSTNFLCVPAGKRGQYLKKISKTPSLRADFSGFIAFFLSNFFGMGSGTYHSMVHLRHVMPDKFKNLGSNCGSLYNHTVGRFYGAFRYQIESSIIGHSYISCWNR